jgi:hypothetical protein
VEFDVGRYSDGGDTPDFLAKASTRHARAEALALTSQTQRCRVHRVCNDRTLMHLILDHSLALPTGAACAPMARL